MTTGGSDDFRASFFEECDELLEAMHDGLGLMQDGAADTETVHVIFRAVHSIKGGAGAFGLDALVSFAHQLETVLERLRSGRIEATPDLLTLFQQCGDYLSDLVTAARADAAVDPGPAEALGSQLNAASGLNGDASEAVSQAADDFVPLVLDLDALEDPQEADADDPLSSRIGHHITFTAEPELFSSGNEPALLFRALATLGPTRVGADISDVPPLSLLDPTMSHLSWVIELDGDCPADIVLDVFDFVSDCASVEIGPLEHFAAPPDPSTVPASDDIDPAIGTDVVAPAEGRPPNSETEGRGDDLARVAPPKPTAAPPQSTTRIAAPQTIRVDFERVDKLINLVGELVIKEAMLSQAVGMLTLNTGNEVLQELDGLKQLAGEIQEGVMAIRAQPIKPLFQRMGRTIREAAAMTNKRVRLVMKGEAAEVDKTVLERLVDPLTHMVRNAVDHGLEDTEARVAAGKPAEGSVTLSAAHRSGRVVIEISDDGGGINRDKVRRLAEEKGLIPPDAPLSPSDIDALLFMPGFSSKDEVSELSGRGVGLDVVRSEITALGGRMSIQSELGVGTVFSISLPLTLAVLEGMVVNVAGQTMVVPITAIQETLQPASVRIHTIGPGTKVLSIRDTLMPVADLGAHFGFREPPEELDDHVLLVIETDTDRRCALIVDALQDQRQVVIKSLETNYSQIDGISAATILGDGRIALIVDPEGVAGGVAPVPATPAASVNPDVVEGDSLVTA